MRHLPLLGLMILSGCGNAALIPMTASDAAPAFADLGGPAETCDPGRELAVQIVTGSAILLRDLPDAGFHAGTLLPSFDVRAFDLQPDDREEVIAAVHALAGQRLSEFGLRIVGEEATEESEGAEAPEIIARVVVTDLPGAPEHCGCQGSTSALGLPSDGPAEAVVFSNAYVDNGLAGVLMRYSRKERIEKLAAALSNSILHEVGHTLGLVHVDVPGQPTLLMARGGSSATKVSLAAMTTLQAYSEESQPVTTDAIGVRETQCDVCVIEDTLAARRECLR